MRVGPGLACHAASDRTTDPSLGQAMDICLHPIPTLQAQYCFRTSQLGLKISESWVHYPSSHSESPDVDELEQRRAVPDASVEAQLQIDPICLQFEREFRTEGIARIEDYLQRLPESLRSLALDELLRVELELLAQRGLTIDADNYRGRFPDDAEVIAVVLGSACAEQSQKHSQQSTSSHLRDTNNLAVRPQEPTTTADEPPAPVPERIGRYELLRALGEGAFGRVYVAHDPQLNRLVALKVPSQRLLDSGRVVEVFLAEARNAASLDHPRVVAVYDGQQDGNQPYIVQQYILRGPIWPIGHEKGNLAPRWWYVC